MPAPSRAPRRNWQPMQHLPGEHPSHRLQHPNGYPEAATTARGQSASSPRCQRQKAPSPQRLKLHCQPALPQAGPNKAIHTAVTPTRTQSPAGHEPRHLALTSAPKTIFSCRQSPTTTVVELAPTVPTPAAWRPRETATRQVAAPRFEWSANPAPVSKRRQVHPIQSSPQCGPVERSRGLGSCGVRQLVQGPHTRPRTWPGSVGRQPTP